MTRAVAATKVQKLMTLEEWGDLDEDVEGELVDGVLEEEEMATFLHEIVVAWLIRMVGAWVHRKHGFVTGSETKIVVGPRRGRKPDLTIHLRGKTPALLDSLVRNPPHAVVEVISQRPRDARRDRVEKIGDYASAGIGYYWILDPQVRTLEIFKLDKGHRYEVLLSRSAGKARIPGCPGLVLNLDELWSEVDQAEGGQRRTTKKRK